MSYSKEIKNIALFKLAKNISITEICTELNISKSTIYRWQKENKTEIENIRASLLIKKLIRNKHIIEALNYCEEERFKDYFPIQKQRITCLIKLGRPEEALALCEEERFKDYFPIQNRRITCLINLGRTEEALALCEEERFKDYFPIQKERITCLINLGRTEEALTLCEEERFKDYFPIQKERINYLTDLGRIDEALALYEEERFNACPVNKKQNVAEDPIKKEIIAEASLNSIFLCLTKSRLDIAFKLLKVYLKNINCTNLEFLIIDLIRLSVLEKDSPFFTRPMMILSLISQNKYTFNIEVYIADFHDALKNAKIKEAEIYLDIIKRGIKLTPLNEKVVIELTEALKKAKLKLPTFVEDIISEVREKQVPILLPLIDNSLTNKVRRFIYKCNDIHSYVVNINGNRRLVLRYNAPFELIDVKGLTEKQKVFYHEGNFEQSIKAGMEILKYVNSNSAYAYIGLAYSKLGNLEQAINYLSIATYLEGATCDFKKFINQLEKEQERKSEDYKSNAESDKTEFSSNNYYGLTVMEDIFIMVLEENIPIDNACQAFRLNPYNTILAKILLAREYYAEGMDFLAEKIIKEVSASPIKNKLIKKVLEETIRNKKLYRNKGSILARLKES